MEGVGKSQLRLHGLSMEEVGNPQLRLHGLAMEEVGKRPIRLHGLRSSGMSHMRTTVDAVRIALEIAHLRGLIVDGGCGLLRV